MAARIKTDFLLFKLIKINYYIVISYNDANLNLSDKECTQSQTYAPSSSTGNLTHV